MNEISPGGSITAFTSGGFSQESFIRNSGKSPTWQVYVQRSEGGRNLRKIINVDGNGWAIVMDDSEVMEYPVWDPSAATIDTIDISERLSSGEISDEWLSQHPNAKLKVQSYHGPPTDSEEISYLLWYTDGDENLKIFISAVDGRVIEDV